MRQRFVNKIYMREVEDYEWTLEKNAEFNCYIAIKQIKKIKKPIFRFTNGERFCLLNEGYSILEYTPLNKNYNVRVFINDKGQVMSYYFDIIKGSGIENNIPYYDDLFLDVIYECNTITKACNFITLLDENELSWALKDAVITQEEYDFAYENATSLMNELKQEKNFFVNRGNQDFIRLKK